jgi:hypothetical protein
MSRYKNENYGARPNGHSESIATFWYCAVPFQEVGRAIVHVGKAGIAERRHVRRATGKPRLDTSVSLRGE